MEWRAGAISDQFERADHTPLFPGLGATMMAAQTGGPVVRHLLAHHRIMGLTSKPGAYACVCMLDFVPVSVHTVPKVHMGSYVNGRQCVTLSPWHLDIPGCHCVPSYVRFCVCMLCVSGGVCLCRWVPLGAW